MECRIRRSAKNINQFLALSSIRLAIEYVMYYYWSKYNISNWLSAVHFIQPVIFMLIHSASQRNRADKNNRDMLQLPRGSKHNIAQNCFEIYIHDPRNIGTPSTTPKNTPHNNTILTNNQLVSTNKHKRSLSPSILRQLEYSNTLLYLAQSPKTPLGVNPFSEAGANPPLNGSNGTTFNVNNNKKNNNNINNKNNKKKYCFIVFLIVFLFTKLKCLEN